MSDWIVERAEAVGAWGRQFAVSLVSDRAFLLFIAAFYVAAALLTAVLGRTYLSAIVFRYLAVWAVLGVWPFLVLTGWHVVSALRRARPARRMSFAWSAFLEFCTPERLVGLCTFLSLAVFMGAFTTVKTLLPEVNSFWADPMLADLDRAMHFGVDPWRLLQPILGYLPVTQAIEAAYIPGWLIMNSGLPFYVAVLHPDRVLRQRYLLSFLACWVICGIVLAVLFMSGGPAFFAGLGGDPERFATQFAYLGQDTGPMSAVGQQRGLWEAYISKGPSIGAGISAFPSLHVSMAVLAMLAGWKIDRRLGMGLAAFATLIFLGSIHLGWHYAVDGYASLAVTFGIWVLAGRLVAGLNRSPGDQDRGGGSTR